MAASLVEQFIEHFIVGCDGVLRWRKTFSSHAVEGKAAGCRWETNKSGQRITYIQVRFRGRLYYAHRVAWMISNGEIDGSMVVDHIDGDGTNNKIENLRLVEQAINMRNARRALGAKNPHVGVTKTRHGSWHAQISRANRTIHLGHFKTLEEAIAARLKAQAGLGYTERHGTL